jgi:hypothetical protein
MTLGSKTARETAGTRPALLPRQEEGMLRKFTTAFGIVLLSSSFALAGQAAPSTKSTQPAKPAAAQTTNKPAEAQTTNKQGSQTASGQSTTKKHRRHHKKNAASKKAAPNAPSATSKSSGSNK